MVISVDSLGLFACVYDRPRGLTVVQSKLKALHAKLISTVASCASCRCFLTLLYSAASTACHTHTPQSSSSSSRQH